MKKKEEKIERNIVLLGFMGCGKSPPASSFPSVWA